MSMSSLKSALSVSRYPSLPWMAIVSVLFVLSAWDHRILLNRTRELHREIAALTETVKVQAVATAAAAQTARECIAKETR